MEKGVIGDEAAGFQLFLESCKSVDFAQLIELFESWRIWERHLCCVILDDVAVAFGEFYSVLTQLINDSPNSNVFIVVNRSIQLTSSKAFSASSVDIFSSLF